MKKIFEFTDYTDVAYILADTVEEAKTYVDQDMECIKVHDISKNGVLFYTEY